MVDLIGKRFRTLTPDYEEDEDFGEVMHPIGAEFIVSEDLGHKEFDSDDVRHGECYSVAWQGTALPGRWEGDEFVVTGGLVPADGMWTIWTDAEMTLEAEPV